MEYLVILVNITGDLAEVTDGKMGENGFNEEDKMKVVLSREGKMEVA